MLEKLVKTRNILIGWLYQKVLKPIFFRIDPEEIHNYMVLIGHFLGKFIITRKITKFFFVYRSPLLEQRILGIKFQNPVGLSAGFDKNALMINIMRDVGFGFTEVGSITGEPCLGNPKPRIWRLKKSKSLAVYYGLKNDGCEIISKRLNNKKFNIPVGVSIAKTNCKATVDTTVAISDYFKAYKSFSHIGDYIIVNISCPNAFGGQPFTEKNKLEALLGRIMSIPKTKPIFLKMSPDLTMEEVDEIINSSIKFGIDGFICTNLTKNRNNSNIKDKDIPEVGGLSGKVVDDLSDKLIKYIYKKTNGKFIIIGSGGIFSAEDAYRKIKAGASLVELITGMIYQGPQVISEINQGLVKLLKKDGYNNISEAIGKE
jgi:dihydroorotate dehydrogenase